MYIEQRNGNLIFYFMTLTSCCMSAHRSTITHLKKILLAELGYSDSLE